jgi:hypothetical protein
VQTFHQAHTGTVKQLGQKSHLTVQKLKHRCDLFMCQHTGNPPLMSGAIQVIEPGQIDAQHLVIQKQQGTERLIVGGC